MACLEVDGSAILPTGAFLPDDKGRWADCRQMVVVEGLVALEKLRVHIGTRHTPSDRRGRALEQSSKDLRRSEGILQEGSFDV